MGIIKEFGLNPILLIAQVVNFTILLFLLQKFLYKPILKVLEERKAKVAKSLQDAEEIEKRLDQIAAEQEKILDKARTEAAKIIDESKAEAKGLSEKTLAETRSSVEEMLAKGGVSLKLEKDQMLSDVKKELAGIVIAATAKVAWKVMDEKTNRKMVEETIKELGK